MRQCGNCERIPTAVGSGPIPRSPKVTMSQEALTSFDPHGARADYDAVKAGPLLPWSTGPVEGHINRLKMLKRSMFGRAKLDLPGQRFLLAA
jgi:hypothetical protein